MRNGEPEVRIVVKRRAGHGGGHHGGAWKVAFADFVTTMMALFIVLWIVGQNAGAREAIAKYFRDPGVFSTGGAPMLAPGGTGILPGGPAAPVRGLAETSGEGDAQAAAEEERALQDARARILALLDSGRPPGSLRDQVSVEVVPEGLRIEISERDNSLLFDIGSAAIAPFTRVILQTLAQVLAKLPNQITVEGHTDSRRYSTEPEYGNWELSADRANAARRVMEAVALSAGRIDSVVGHADRLLKVPDDPLHASNRRITILVRRGEARQPGAPGPAHRATPRPASPAGLSG
jgi:chemotaxis protein MotB